ncbi:MAG: hypothetical protein ACE5ET_03610 [Gammaproteobacteria bacterium]
MKTADHSALQALQRLHKIQNTIATTLAITMGTLMVTYFFTFAMLIDKGYHGALLLEVITSILFIIAFFFLNQLSFRIIRLIYGQRKPYAELLRQLTPCDAGLSPQQVLERIMNADGKS